MQAGLIGIKQRLGWRLAPRLAALALVSGLSVTAAHSDTVGVYEQPAGVAQEFVALKKSAAAMHVSATPVELGPLSAQKLQSAQEEQRNDGVFKLGATRASNESESPAAMRSLLRWQPASQGGQVAAVSFRSDGAFGVRIGLLIDALPGSALLRIYREGERGAAFEIAGQRVLQILQANRNAGDNSDAGRTWWAPGADGDEQTLEIELPPGVSTDSVRVSVPQVLHMYVDLSLPLAGEADVAAKLNESASCHLDSTCYAQYASERNAVARMVYVKGDGMYACTGTLLNDRNSTGTPYFMTANHCISDQTTASTLQTSWFYRTPTCNSRTLSSATRTLQTGATLLYTTEQTDATLLRLNDAPPAGAVFAAWDSGFKAIGSSVVGIHHPRGDLQKISFGQINALYMCVSDSSGGMLCSTSGVTQSNATYYNVRWSSGSSEQGSSGSGLFVNGVFAGTLTGGADTCSVGSSSIYGRFDKFYPAVSKWLYPEVTTPTTPPGGRSPVYRFFNRQSGAHFYTNNAAERDFVIATYPVFQYENVAFYAYGAATTGKSAVFRFFNKQTGTHFYTANEGERDFVRQTYAAFNYEGPVWYAQTVAGNDAVPIFRFFNTQTGAHFYTTNEAERDFVRATYPAFNYEGAVYYVWTAQ